MEWAFLRSCTVAIISSLLVLRAELGRIIKNVTGHWTLSAQRVIWIYHIRDMKPQNGTKLFLQYCPVICIEINCSYAKNFHCSAALNKFYVYLVCYRKILKTSPYLQE